MNEGFISRWARLKRSREHDTATSDQEKPPLERGTSSGTAAPVEAPAGASGSAADPVILSGTTESGASQPGKTPEKAAWVDPNDDLPPIASLTPASDFTPFLRPGVVSKARNAALKKLFTDPHYNVMDGLDVYIDDYNVTEPIPEQALARLLREHGSQVLAATGQPGLVDETSKRIHDGTNDVAHDKAAISSAGTSVGHEEAVGADEKASDGETLNADEQAGTEVTTFAGEKRGSHEAAPDGDRPDAQNSSLEPAVVLGGTSSAPDDRVT